MCGFLGATIVNSVVDSALGYATNEIGPRWHQRQPVPITRWQTLLIKWAIVAAHTAVLTAVMLAGAGRGTGHGRTLSGPAVAVGGRPRYVRNRPRADVDVPNRGAGNNGPSAPLRRPGS